MTATIIMEGLGAVGRWMFGCGSHLFQLNACRHSHSNRILVGLTQDHDRIGVQIQDWGTGFDPNGVGNCSHGLKSILYRAKSLGSTAIIDACRGEGTCIMVELPLPEQDADASPSMLLQFPK
jgi:nitrate/nitrite-specific signal transduction histidine kinase